MPRVSANFLTATPSSTNIIQSFPTLGPQLLATSANSTNLTDTGGGKSTFDGVRGNIAMILSQLVQKDKDGDEILDMIADARRQLGTIINSGSTSLTQ